MGKTIAKSASGSTKLSKLGTLQMEPSLEKAAKKHGVNYSTI
jgi:hypothetical protein